MLKTILTKTLYEKRMSMLFWAIGIAAIVMFTMSVYHSFSEPGGLGDSLQNLPKGLQGLVGDTSTFKTIPGFVGQQIFALRAPLILIIFGLITSTGLLVSEENDGTLQTLLVQPISRTRVFLEKLLALMVMMAIVSLGIIIGIEIALALLGEHISLLRLIQSTFGVWLITLVFATFTLMLGAVTGKKGLASGLGAALTFTCYLVTSLVSAVSWLKTPEKLSPFHYYNNPAIAQHGLNGSHIALLSGLIVMMVIISLVMFNRRDVYQR